MTELLSARIAAKKATNEEIARSRGWVRDEGGWISKLTGWVIMGRTPDYLGDIRLTISDAKAKGWEVGFDWAEGIASAWIGTAQYIHGQIEAPDETTALLLAFAKAQEAGVTQEAPEVPKTDRRPICIWHDGDLAAYYAATEKEQDAWNDYANEAARRFNNDPSLDSYDSTHTYSGVNRAGEITNWAPPTYFPEWLARYRERVAK